MSEVTDPEVLLNREYGKDLETRRWFILLSFSIFSASNAMLWITYSPISDSAGQYYGVGEDAVIQFSNAYMYVYFAFSFIGSWLAYRWFTPTLLTAMVINVIGAWLRYIAGTSYALALVGQYLAALAQNVVLFVPVLIADRWFSATERTWAVTIATLSNLLGWGFGFIFPTILVQGGYEEVRHIMLYEAIIASVPLAIGAVSIKEKPKVPPSYSAMVKLSDHDSFWHEVLSTVKNVKFMIATVCFGNLIGQSYTLSSVIVLFIPTASLIEQGLVGIAFIGSGILGGFAATAYLSTSKTEKYDPILRIFMIISLIGIIVLALVIKEGMVGIYLLNSLLGVGLLGFQPFAAQTVVEMTFPVQESISVNFMMVMGQLFGVIGNFLSTASFVGENGLWALTGLVTPCVIYITFFHKTETKRQEAEKRHKKIDKEGVNSIISAEGSHGDQQLHELEGSAR